MQNFFPAQTFFLGSEAFVESSASDRLGFDALERLKRIKKLWDVAVLAAFLDFFGFTMT